MSITIESITNNGNGTLTISYEGARDSTSVVTFYSSAVAGGPFVQIAGSGTSIGMIGFTEPTVPSGFAWYEAVDTFAGTSVYSPPVSATCTNGSPPTLPIVERVAQQIVNRLTSIAPVLSFNYAAISVVRPTRTFSLLKLVDKSIVVLQESAERLEESEVIAGGTGSHAWRQPFSILGLVILSDTDTTAVDEGSNLFMADIVGALSLAPSLAGTSTNSAWIQFADAAGGPLALNSYISGLGMIDDPTGAVAGAIVGYTVEYRTAENNVSQLI